MSFFKKNNFSVQLINISSFTDEAAVVVEAKVETKVEPKVETKPKDKKIVQKQIDPKDQEQGISWCSKIEIFILVTIVTGLVAFAAIEYREDRKQDCVGCILNAD